MLINLFKPVDSFSLFNRKNNPTLADCTKAEQQLKNKINKVANILKIHAEKHNIIKCNADTGVTTLFNGEIIKDSPQDLKLVANALMGISRFNNSTKKPVFTKEISKLSKSLDKYSDQFKTLENKKQQAKVYVLRKIVETNKKLADMKENSLIPAAIEEQKAESRMKLDEIKKTAKKTGEALTPSQWASENLQKLIDHLVPNPNFLKEKGIFRESPPSSIIKSLMDTIYSGDSNKNKLDEIENPHAFSLAIKKLFSLELTDKDKLKIEYLVKRYSEGKAGDVLLSLKNLPLPIKQLMPLLVEVKRNQATNLMDTKSLAICIAPNMQRDLVIPESCTATQRIKLELEANKLNIEFLSALIDDASKRPIPAPRTSLSKTKT